MKRRNFKISHSIIITLCLLLVQWGLIGFNVLPIISVLTCAAIGAIVTIYVATEAVEEVQGSRHLFIMLSVVLLQFIIFFGFEHWFLLLVNPQSFPTLVPTPANFFLTSIMEFVFNPLSAPDTDAGRILLTIDTLGSLGLVMFVLQNISQFRRKSLDAHE